MPQHIYPFYFGCHERAGHYWWCRGDTHLVQAHGSAPTHLDGAIDGCFCPPGEQAEGLANIVHLNFHGEPATILSFWDRSVDLRGNSNSNFLMKGTLDFERAVAVAEAYFPEVWARFKFRVVEWRP